MRTRPLGLALATLLLLLPAVPAWSAISKVRRPVLPVRLQRVGRIQDFDYSRRIDVNTINMFTTNIGSTAWDLNSGNAGLFWPKGTTNTSVFAAGLWLAGMVGGQIRMAAAEYTQDYVPGPMIGGTFADAKNPDFKVYKVARFTGDPQDTAHVERAATELAADLNLDPLLHHSWSEYLLGAAPYGAPTRWYHLNPSAPNDSVLGPDVLGDQMLWTVYNDADPNSHGGDFTPATGPLGIEVQQTTFGFNRQGPLANTVFLRYKLYNKGPNRIDSMFVSIWCDPDLGGFTDDLVGCDTTLSLGYCYNATNTDAVYGSRPPAEGFDFFLGPKENGVTLPMTSFNKYINGTDPASPDEVYNYMNGLTGAGEQVIDPNNVVTKFFHAGDPVTGTGWLDTNPADRRFLMSSGPFTMLPGDSQEVVTAFIIAQGSDRLASITGLKFFDKQAQAAFDLDFNLPPPPPQPKVQVSATHAKVELCWDIASQFNYQAPPGYAFEGYNVYQGASKSGPWKRLFTYDIVNGIGVVRDTVFDTQTGQLISDYPVAFGGDNGISHCFSTTTDAVRGGPLRDATTYYFAVTAYAVGLGEEPRVLENSISPIAVMPTNGAAGTSFSTALVECPRFVRSDPSLPGTTDQVQVEVVNPAAVTGHLYAITFAPLPKDTVIGGTTVTVGWNLVDRTTGTVVLADQVNKSGDLDYRVVDGLLVKVIGPYDPVNAFNSADYFGAACPVFPDPNPPFKGVSAGLEGFGGGAGTDFNFFNGLDPGADADSFTTVEIRFSNTVKQSAHRYLRLEKASDGSAPPQGRGYVYAGFHPVGFTAWDVQHNVQLDVGFVERGFTDDNGSLLPGAEQPATFDSTWMPDVSDNGGREYLFISKYGYTGAPNPALAVDAAALNDAKWEYAAWLKRKGAATPANGDVFRWIWGQVPGTPRDTILLQTKPLVRNNAALARSRLDRVRVVPNPYYTRSRYEPDQFNRVVRFTNLPEVCTIRIFNLAGELVRTIQKTDGTVGTQDWDLLTSNRLPVASGIYIYHIDAPGVGSTFGRMVIFMEKERLNSL